MKMMKRLSLVVIICTTWLFSSDSVQAGYCYVNGTPETVPAGCGVRWELYMSGRVFPVCNGGDGYESFDGSYDDGLDVSRNWTLEIYYNNALVDTKQAYGYSVMIYVTLYDYIPPSAPTAVSASDCVCMNRVRVAWEASGSNLNNEHWPMTGLGRM